MQQEALVPSIALGQAYPLYILPLHACHRWTYALVWHRIEFQEHQLSGELCVRRLLLLLENQIRFQDEAFSTD